MSATYLGSFRAHIFSGLVADLEEKYQLESYDASQLTNSLNGYEISTEVDWSKHRHLASTAHTSLNSVSPYTLLFRCFRASEIQFVQINHFLRDLSEFLQDMGRQLGSRVQEMEVEPQVLLRYLDRHGLEELKVGLLLR